MIRKTIYYVCLLTSASLFIGCTGPQVARNVASQMSKLTLDYEVASTAKADAERTFYKDQLQVLRNALSGTTDVTVNGRSDLVKTLGVKNTIAYGQIRTSIDRDAILLANMLSSSPNLPKVSTRLIEFLDSGVKENLVAYLSASQRQRRLKIDLLDGLEKIDQQSNRLKVIRLELQKLETDTSMEDKFKQYFVIGKAVSDQINLDEENQ